ncbi:MAG: DUF1631 family protein [Marinicellaceae bacterium]
MRSSPKIGQNNLINSCLQIFEKSLLASFKNAISKTLVQLFELAENAKSNQQEVTLFEQYNLLKKSSGKLMDFLSAVIQSMPDEITEQISHEEDEVKLSLVEDEILEISLALTQLESVLDIKFSKYLFALEKRLKILFATRKISKDNMPFGVVSICWIFSQTFENSGSDVKTKVLLIECLKKQCGEDLLDVYKKIDDVFIKAGILPNIKTENKKPKKENIEKLNNEHDNLNEFSKNNQGSQSTRQDQLSGKGQQEGYNQFGHNKQETSDGQFSQTLNNESSQSIGASEGSESNQVSRGGSSNLVNSIFDLMNQDKQMSSSQSGLTSIENSVMDETLQNLSKITSIAAGATEIDKLKEMILDNVRNETGMFYPELNTKQQNSLDVMGMFYDHVKQDDMIDSNILSSLNAINIPLIRTAIKDDKFFTNGNHPARQYLEKIIYAAQKWHGTPVVKKLHQFSSHLASDYDGSDDSFNSANEDLESFLKTTETRAKNTEEKWVNSAKGKEKLDYSRMKVEGIVDEISNIAVPEFVKNVIKYVIQDALTLTLLRHGENSDEWNKNIAMSNTIAKLANGDEVKNLTPKQKIESLHRLDQTMDDLGFSENDRKATIQNVKECSQAAVVNKLDENIELDNVASINKNKIDLNKSNAAKIEDIRELTAQEKSQLTRIKLMPYGTLFDFIINQQRDKIRRKLSWFSPVSNKALFVSMLGNKPYEKSLNAIAIDLARKNIIVIKLEEKKYFNQVMQGIFSKLKKMVKND